MARKSIISTTFASKYDHQSFFPRFFDLNRNSILQVLFRKLKVSHCNMIFLLKCSYFVSAYTEKLMEKYQNATKSLRQLRIQFKLEQGFAQRFRNNGLEAMKSSDYSENIRNCMKNLGNQLRMMLTVMVKNGYYIWP